MKKYYGIGLAVVSIAVIIIGNFHYDNKLSSIAEDAQNQNLIITQYTAPESSNGQVEQPEEELDEVNEEEVTEEESPVIDLDLLNPDFAEAIMDVRETGGELKIAVYASDVMLGIEGDGQVWPELLDNILSERLHDISYQIAVYSTGDLNTVDLIQTSDYDRVIEEDRHLVILESMLWNDNGQVSHEQSVEYIEQMKSAFEQAGSEVITLLSLPAYQTVNYPAQIDYFSGYAEENNWLIADHWSYWPELSDEALLTYVDDESRYLTQAGHEVVADSIFTVLGLE